MPGMGNHSPLRGGEEKRVPASTGSAMLKAASLHSWLHAAAPLRPEAGAVGCSHQRTVSLETAYTPLCQIDLPQMTSPMQDHIWHSHIGSPPIGLEQSADS